MNFKLDLLHAASLAFYVTYPNEVLKGFKNLEQKHTSCPINGGGGCVWSIRTPLPLKITFLWWCPIFWFNVSHTKYVLIWPRYYLSFFFKNFFCYKNMILQIVYSLCRFNGWNKSLNHILLLELPLVLFSLICLTFLFSKHKTNDINLLRYIKDWFYMYNALNS